jgi:hypothetical protein
LLPAPAARKDWRLRLTEAEGGDGLRSFFRLAPRFLELHVGFGAPRRVFPVRHGRWDSRNDPEDPAPAEELAAAEHPARNARRALRWQLARAAFLAGATEEAVVATRHYAEGYEEERFSDISEAFFEIHDLLPRARADLVEGSPEDADLLRLVAEITLFANHYGGVFVFGPGPILLAIDCLPVLRADPDLARLFVPEAKAFLEPCCGGLPRGFRSHAEFAHALLDHLPAPARAPAAPAATEPPATEPAAPAEREEREERAEGPARRALPVRAAREAAERRAARARAAARAAKAPKTPALRPPARP